jgi:ABC-type dipeptide/oligopeptide/nickel transport system ATPase component
MNSKKKNNKQNEIANTQPISKPSSVINFYELDEVKAFDVVRHNPNFETHKITIPFRMAIIGASGSGKSNIVMNLISQFNNTFNHIIIFTKNKIEPLYQFLEQKIPHKDDLEIFEGLEELNKMKLDTEFKGQNLIIFDDMVLEKDQSQIEQLFIRGRKLGDGVSLAYLSQSYFGIPRKIRLQVNYLILRKVPSSKDIVSIIRECSMGIDKDQLMQLYNYAVTKSITNFLLIDFNVDPELMFRKNFDEILSVNN